nr:putative ribonuclease H-like domain-containing protein [Tanacetum cinerariifolium]
MANVPPNDPNVDALAIVPAPVNPDHTPAQPVGLGNGFAPYWIGNNIPNNQNGVRNKMHKAFSLLVRKFPLPEGTSHCLKNIATGKRKVMPLPEDCTDVIVKKKLSVKDDDFLKISSPCPALYSSSNRKCNIVKYKTAQELWAAILKTFGGNEATKKTKKNLLKQQYGNFRAKGSKTLEQMFSRLQVIVGQLQSDLDTMSLDDLYNHLKVFESEVQKKLEPNTQNMAFIFSAKHNRGNDEVNTTSVYTTSSNLSTASANVATVSISQETTCAYIASQSSRSQIKFEYINQIDEDDMEEMDIKWNMALLSIRADKFWKKTGKKINIQGSDVARFDKSKVECFNCHKMGHFTRECRAPRNQDRGRRDTYRQGSKAKEQAPKALMAIDRVGWDWSYMANDEEDHALVADEEAPIEFALMANTSTESKTGLPKWADDTVTDYSRPSPTVEGKGDARLLKGDNQNRNSVLFTDSECIVLGRDFKLLDDANILLRTPRQHNMYSIDLNNIVPHRYLTCLVAKASADECYLWHRRLGHLNFKTMNKLVRHNLVRGLPTKCFENDQNCTACLKGKQHKASCKSKLVTSVSKPLYTLHMDLFSPTLISSISHKWHCLVVTDDFSRFIWTFFLKTKDETSSILKKFITEIENLKDLKVKIIRCDNEGEFRNKELNDFVHKRGLKENLAMLGLLSRMVWLKGEIGKFKPKGDEGYFLRYSMSSKAFRVFNKRTKRVEENLHIEFLENKAIEKGSGPNWLFDIDSLTKSMNYVPVVDADTNFTNFLGTKVDARKDVKKDVSSLRYIILPNWVHEEHLESISSQPQDPCNTDTPESSGNSNPTATSINPLADQVETLTVETPIPTFEDTLGVAINSKESNGVEADVSNMEASITASPTPTLRIHKDHPKIQIIGHVDTPIQTRNKSKEEELLQFKIQNVWTLVDCPKGVRPIGTKWVLKNKKDERGIVIRNKARIVAQGHTQEEGIDYDEVFAPVARIEAIRLFLAYASFMDFVVYQMDVKSVFLYGTIDEEVSSKTPMDKENPWGKEGTGKDVDLYLYRSMIGSLMYLTASRPDIMFAGEGSGTSTEPHHTPSPVAQTPSHTAQPTSSLPPSSALPPVADEPASPVRDVSQREACPTNSGFIADQDRATIAKSSTLPLESAPRVTSPVADEGNIATVLARGIDDVPTGSGSIPTAGPPAADIPTGSDVVPTASLVFATATLVTPYSRRKGKEVMVESDTTKKQRLQEQIDTQVDRELEEQLEKEDKRMYEQIARDAEVARIHAEEELQSMIDGLDRNNETIAKYLQEYQQFAAELPLERRIELISDLVKYQENYANIYKFQSQQRRLWTKKQKRDYYMAVIRNNLGWKVKDFKGMTFEEVEAKFNSVYKQMEDFIPMGSKEEAERYKIKGIRFDQKSSKKHKSLEEVIEEAKSTNEIPKEKIKEMMQLIPTEEVYVEALQVKHPIIDWKVHKEGQRSYWKIIKLGRSLACYQFFVDLLKHLDREDLNQLWILTQNFMHGPIEWKLYDLSGVHQVTAKDKEIFMLVEKDYPLRKGLALVMICYKLQVENFSQMANDLVLKIYKIANSSRQQGRIVRNKMHKAFPLLIRKFPLPEGTSHCLKKIATAKRKVMPLPEDCNAVIVKKKLSFKDDDFLKISAPCPALYSSSNCKCNIVYKDSLYYKRSPLVRDRYQEDPEEDPEEEPEDDDDDMEIDDEAEVIDLIWMMAHVEDIRFRGAKALSIKLFLISPDI